jgi:HEAT repeat protein
MQAEEILRHALESKNPDTRKNAVVALSLASGNDPLYARLESMLDDSDVPVRLAVVASLAEVKTRKATEALESALNDPVPEVSFAAAKALYALNDPKGKEALLAVMGGETKATSGFLTKEKRSALRMMHTPNTAFLYIARAGVGFAGVPGLGLGVASLQAILAEGAASGRATAALLLGNERDPETVEALKEALSDKDWRLRAAAVHSLALMNDLSLRKAIAPMLEDDKEEVRLRAAAAWLRMAAVEKAQTAKRPARKEGAPTKGKVKK